MKANKPH